MYIVSSEKTATVTMTLDVKTDSIAGIEVPFVGDNMAAANAVVHINDCSWQQHSVQLAMQLIKLCCFRGNKFYCNINICMHILAPDWLCFKKKNPKK
jgi:hypothetical protein